MPEYEVDLAEVSAALPGLDTANYSDPVFRVFSLVLLFAIAERLEVLAAKPPNP